MPNPASTSVENIKKAALQAVLETMPSGVYFGTVVSSAPLSINVEQKMTLTESQLVLSTLVQDFTVNMSVNHSTNNHTHTHDITDTYSGGGSASSETHNHSYTGTKAFTVHLKLSAGEKVILLRVQGGQKFIVLDRVR